MASTPTKADLIARITSAWSTLEATLAGVDEAGATAPGPDRWSVKDHLAHIEGWDRYLLAVLEGRSPSAAVGSDLATIRATEEDPLNELLIEPAKVQPYARVLTDPRRTHEQLLAVVANVPDADLGRPATDYQLEELAGDTDSIAGWIDHICDEHLRDTLAGSGSCPSLRDPGAVQLAAVQLAVTPERQRCDDGAVAPSPIVYLRPGRVIRLFPLSARPQPATPPR